MTDQFIKIIEKANEQQLFSLLQSLSQDEKKELVPQIKKLTKEYEEYGDLGFGRYGHLKGTDKQREMLQSASFVCFNLAEYKKSSFTVWMLERERLNKVIDWYCPSWFSDFANGLVSNEWIPHYLSYEWLMELTQRGFLNPSRELLAKQLPQLIFEQDKDRKWQFKPENLLRLKVTLEEHIWYLFEFESNIHTSVRYLHFGNTVSKEETGWIEAFKKYANENLIDRTRLMKESLIASNRNFNKVLSGWFSELFSELEPTKKELISLQTELFSALNSPHSKPINTSLQAIKKIATDPEFTPEGFLDIVPVLLASDIKSTIVSTLMILEKIAQKNPAFCDRIASISCQSFIHSDDELQARAAKLISKIGDVTSISLRDELINYYPGMLATARKTLIEFHDAEVKIVNTEPVDIRSVETTTNLSELTEIPFPASIDDLIFLASQAFDNNEPWHIDILPAALVKFRSQLKAEHLPLFEPAFQRAFGIVNNNFRSTEGHLDNLLALFFIDYGNWLIRTYPNDREPIVNFYKKYDKKVGEQNTSFLVSPEIGSYTARWEDFSKILFYHPFKHLLVGVLDRLNSEIELPLLSTPTHAPCWITPEVLIIRLQQYQHARQEPGQMDLQVAISRVLLNGETYSVRNIKEKLTGELCELMIFLLDEKATPKEPFHYKASWMVASLSKRVKKAWPVFQSFTYYKMPIKNYTGELHWETKVEHYKSHRWDYNTGKSIEEPATRKSLFVYREYNNTKESGFKKLFSKFFSSHKEDPPMLYELMNFRVQFLALEHNDIKRILSLIPNNPAPILADTLNKSLKNLESGYETDSKFVVAVLQFLFDTWREPGEMATLFLGTCLLSSDKTVINTAGEVWLRFVSAGSINNFALGKVIGHHERIEFAPIKRFTDLLSKNLFRVSDLHNRELQVLIENILIQLPDEPIKNLKKLLEIYRELLALNNSSVESQEVLGRLKVWGETSGLRKTIESMVLLKN